MLGARTAHYSPANDAISRLAAVHAPTRAAMTAGFVAFGVGVPLYGLALRSTLPGRAWMLATATGLATLGVGAFPLDWARGDAPHAVAATLGYVTLAATPLVAARTLGRQGRRGWARVSRVAGVTSAVSLAATVIGPYHGAFQRVGLTVGDAWIVASALGIVARRRHRCPRP
ncbi:MAG: DUF998 domain-containing protein [Actinobacteria bacterium]|nr:DUF998 domain-containing protein [Actinomycetota bacterium]